MEEFGGSLGEFFGKVLGEFGGSLSVLLGAKCRTLTCTAGPEEGRVGAAFAWLTFLLATVASLLVTLAADLWFPHASEIARRAQADMVSGHFRMHWMVGIVVGHGLPLALLIAGHPAASAAAFVAAAVGLFAYAYAFVMAPQMVPNS